VQTLTKLYMLRKNRTYSYAHARIYIIRNFQFLKFYNEIFLYVFLKLYTY